MPKEINEPESWGTLPGFLTRTNMKNQASFTYLEPLLLSIN